MNPFRMEKSLMTAAAFLIVGAAAVASSLAWTKESKMKEVRTYMSYSFPVDPAKIYTIPDMDLSYGLASTLVEWNADKQITAGIASRWEIVEDKVFRFTIRQTAKWSNGNAITAREVKSSFERSMRTYPEDLRAVINLVESIKTPNDRTIEFHLKTSAKNSNLLGKLVEPNFGVLWSPNGKEIDLSVGCGPFTLASSSKAELLLKKNIHWHRASAEMPEQVVVRKPALGMDAQTVLMNDPWPNLVETSSLISAEILKRYQAEGYQIWKRPFDKIFLFELKQRMRNEEGFKLIRSLAAQLKRDQVTAGLAGFQLTDQIFPHGYQLHSPEHLCGKPVVQPVKRKLNVLVSPARVSPQLQENLRRAITTATGEEPNMISVALDELSSRSAKGDIDIYAGTVGLADPDPEGVMSFYFEGDDPVIPSGSRAYVASLDAARKEPDQKKKLVMMRSLVSDAICEGHVLPLFHVSTVGIARKGLDLSQIPTSEESVTLSKIRFK